MILHNEFGLIWKTPRANEKELFLKLVIRENSQISKWKPNFFLDQLIEKKFLFGLIWMTPWTVKKVLFLKLIIHEIRKFPYEDLSFY